MHHHVSYPEVAAVGFGLVAQVPATGLLQLVFAALAAFGALLGGIAAMGRYLDDRKARARR